MTADQAPGAWLAEQAEQAGQAGLAERAGAELGGRARLLLAEVAARLREAAAVYEADPTLSGDPAGRERLLDLICELGRQVVCLVRQACRPDGPRRRAGERWEEAEALAARLPVLLAQARAQARPDHATPAGSQEISQLWLEAAHPQIRRAAEQLQAALERALSLPHPSPRAAELSRLAAEVAAESAVLAGAWQARQRAG